MLKDWAEEVHKPVTGWPTRSLMGRLEEEGPVGAAIHAHDQKIPGLRMMAPRVKRVHIAWKQLSERSMRVIWVFYYPRTSYKDRKDALGVTKSTMYRWLDKAHDELEIKLLRMASQNSQSSQSMGKKMLA
jgi:hypothetical protein